jgi:hypothetical protein
MVADHVKGPEAFEKAAGSAADADVHRAPLSRGARRGAATGRTVALGWRG